MPLIRRGFLLLVVLVLMSSAVRGQAKQRLPEVNDERLSEILHSSSRTFFYDDRSLPPVTQLQDMPSGGFLPAQASVHPSGRAVHAPNRHFPWQRTAGLPVDGHTLKFVWLPPNRPVRWFLGRFVHPLGYRSNGRLRFQMESGTQVRWIFPVGTYVGEILYTARGNPFEVRVFIKEADDWGIEVYSPFPSAKDLQLELRQDATVEAKSISSTHPTKVYSRQYKNTVFPRADESLLNRAFKPVVLEFHPPTGGPFPADYEPEMKGVTRDDCRQCHRTAGVSSQWFASVMNGNLEWYGSIRGDDRIFSFHPHDPRFVTRAGSKFRPNPDLVRRGLLVEGAPDGRDYPLIHSLEFIQ